jgi:ABC-2 type transport system permease protein
VTAALRAMPELLRVGIAGVVAYRAEFVIWILSATLPLVMLALWNAVVAEGPIVGFGEAEVARYFTAALVVRQLTGAWVLWQLNHEIRTGGLSPRLLRPLHPLWTYAAEMIAALPLRLVVLTPLLVGLALWKPELVAIPAPTALATFALSIALAWTASFLVQAWFALLAFWTEQSLGLYWMWFAAWMVLSGYVAPAAMFPDWARDLMTWLPFRGMFGVPVELLGGFLTPADALPEVAIQLGWTLILLALVAWTWKRGVRRYGAYGA